MLYQPCHQPLRYVWRYRAHRARAKGAYNKASLVLFWRAWQSSQARNDQVAYLLFRRDLGLPLPGRIASKWLVILAELSALLVKRSRSPSVYLRACALLIERWALDNIGHQKNSSQATNGLCAPADFPALLSHHLVQTVDPAVIQIPALLQLLDEHAYKYKDKNKPVKLNAFQQWLADLNRQQAQQQALWAEAAKAAIQQAGICVVGNAGFMKGTGLGQRIDQHSQVIRFNHYGAAGVDVGTRVDVHVVTAGMDVSQTPADRVVLSGPDLRYRLLDWSAFAGLQSRSVRVLTLPLPVWRALVAELKAPPSAGIACLYYLWHLIGSWDGVSVAGFTALQAHSRVNDHISQPKQQTSGRHNWEGECVMLKRWLQQGLSSLHG